MHYDEQNDVSRLINCTLFVMLILGVLITVQVWHDSLAIMFR